MTERSDNNVATGSPNSDDNFKLEMLFIRHAESMENMKFQSLSESLNSIRTYKLPTGKQFSFLVKLLAPDSDCPLSLNGINQLTEMKKSLDEKKFWSQQFPFDLCVYSPCQRTKETCFAIMPHSLHSKCFPLEELKELSLLDYLLFSKVEDQIVLFQKYLFNLNKKIHRIVVFGHSKYFMKLLSRSGNSPFAQINVNQSSLLMKNCDIWKVTYQYNVNDILSGKFLNKPKLIYRSPQRIHTHYPSNNNNDEQNNNPTTSPSISSPIAEVVAVLGAPADNFLHFSFSTSIPPVTQFLEIQLSADQPNTNTSNTGDNQENNNNNANDNDNNNNEEEEEDNEPACRICQVRAYSIILFFSPIVSFELIQFSYSLFSFLISYISGSTVRSSSIETHQTLSLFRFPRLCACRLSEPLAIHLRTGLQSLFNLPFQISNQDLEDYEFPFATFGDDCDCDPQHANLHSWFGSGE
jgi:phosphohistidine phosphatase SixA